MMTVLELELGGTCPGVMQAALMEALLDRGIEGRMVLVQGVRYVVINGTFPGEGLDLSAFGVRAVHSCSSAFPMVSRDVRGASWAVQVGDVMVGEGAFAVMAGPCSVESREQIVRTALAVKAQGAAILRGGAFKPRSSPYSFQGLMGLGVRLLKEASRAARMPVVTEVMDPHDVEWLSQEADLLQIGARNMQNFPLLREVGRSQRPVLLKRGMMATVEEWLQAAEYIASSGNCNIILCERGIRSFDRAVRNVLDLSVVPLVKKISCLPVVVDPSHGTGRRDLVIPMSLAAVAAGADGLIVEVHPSPGEALCDGDQSLDFRDFQLLMEAIGTVRRAVMAAGFPGEVPQCSAAM